MTQPTGTPAPRAPGMAFILAVIFLDMMGLGIAIPVTPTLVAGYVGGDLSVASHHVGTMGALYTAMMFLFAPLLGALSDRFGRKPVLLAALTASSISYFWAAAAPTLFWLLLARGLGGFGGASVTVAQTYIADVSSHADRAKNFGLVGAAFGLGFIIGPAVGGLLGGYGVTVPFIAAGVMSLLNLLYGAFFVPESHHIDNRRPFRWIEANPLGFIVTLRENPVVLGFAAAMVWMWFGHQTLQNTWVLYTTYRFHWTTIDNGLSLAVVGVSSVIVQGWLISILLPKLGERRAILYGLMLASLTLAAYGLAPQGWMMYVIIVLGSIGGIAGPALQGLVSRQVGPSQQGALQGALTSLMSLTGIVGPLVANNLFAHFTAADAPYKMPGIAFFLGSFSFIIASCLAWRLLNRLQAAPTVAPVYP